MTTTDLMLYTFIGVILLTVLIIIIVKFFENPFEYPEVLTRINLSGRRRPSYIDCIDQWIIDDSDTSIMDEYNYALDKWDEKCEARIKKTILWKKRKIQFYQNMRNEVLDYNYHMFVFEFFRRQTRYQQENYNRTAYYVNHVEKTITKSLQEMLDIEEELSEIDFETTREKYHAKNQRRLMTKELRRSIMERDNYTCQICGKYMPDEVGLHIDHIIPIKKGGKSVESNLQVLCDKCNLSKGTSRQ